MSIPVDVADLPEAMARFAQAFLLTTPRTGERAGRVKTVSVAPRHEEGWVRLPGPGRGSLLNVADNPVATLLLPPTDPAAHSLIVDGRAEIDGEDVVLLATSAVLHRSHA
jgi:hypothetical protein